VFIEVIHIKGDNTNQIKGEKHITNNINKT